MPAPKGTRTPKPPSDDAFGDIVFERAWERLKPSFEAWAARREEVLKGYRRREIQVTFQHSEPVRRMHLQRLETQRLDPGRFAARSALTHVGGGGGGHVYLDGPLPARPPEVTFNANLPTPYLSEHPEAEDVVRSAIAHACEVTGLHMQVISDVRGGSNWVVEGRLGPKPTVDAVPDDEPEEEAGFRP